MAVATVVIGGGAETFTNAPSEAFGTVFDSQGSGDFFINPPPGAVGSSPASSTSQLQWTATPTAPWTTLNLFLGEFCRVYTLTPSAAMVALMSMLQQMRTGVYQ